MIMMMMTMMMMLMIMVVVVGVIVGEKVTVGQKSGLSAADSTTSFKQFSGGH